MKNRNRSFAFQQIAAGDGLLPKQDCRRVTAVLQQLSIVF
jgi:hypothetical protein